MKQALNAKNSGLNCALDGELTQTAETEALASIEEFHHLPKMG
jgi:hypothetical protein